MSENPEIVNLQSICNSIIHETVNSLYASSLKSVDPDTAVEILISALASNLGYLLSQFPDDLQENWNKIALQVVGKSVLESTIHMDTFKYGKIGRA